MPIVKFEFQINFRESFWFWFFWFSLFSLIANFTHETWMWWNEWMIWNNEFWRLIFFSVMNLIIIITVRRYEGIGMAFELCGRLVLHTRRDKNSPPSLRRVDFNRHHHHHRIRRETSDSRIFLLLGNSSSRAVFPAGKSTEQAFTRGSWRLVHATPSPRDSGDTARHRHGGGNWIEAGSN